MTRTNTLPPHRRAPATPRRRLVAALLVLGAVLGVGSSLAAVSWGGGIAHGGEAATLSLDGATLRVEQVSPEVMVHPAAMPAQMMPDPVPAGQRRFALTVTLVNDSGADVSYDGGDLRVTGRGVEPAAPVRDGLGTGTLPDGTRLSGVLVFQAPQSARTLRLVRQGAAGSLPFGVPAAAGGHGHGDDHGGDDGNNDRGVHGDDHGGDHAPAHEPAGGVVVGGGAHHH